MSIPRSQRNVRRRPLPCLLLAALALVCPASLSYAADDANAADPPVDLRRTRVVEVIEANRRSVVNVNTTTTVRQSFGPFSRDPLFRRFFRGFERDVTRTSLGSGFILHEAGYIATNAHVVDGADEVEVNLADGATLPARVLASDAEHDLAVLKIDPPDDQPLPPVRLGESSDLLQGEPAVAIGNPLGYHHSVSSGIISAVDRPLPLDRDTALQGLIQTDAPINPGNSGGPLLNIYGQVIGINTAIRGDAQNIGFAIPVNQLRDLLPALLSPLAINRVDLGGALEEQRTVTGPGAHDVTLLWRPDDPDAEPVEVTEIDGEPVADVVDAAVALLDVTDRPVPIGNARRQIELRPHAPALTDAQRLARSMMGLTPRQITVADRARLGLGKAKGLLIESIERGGPADRAGLEPGDLIVQLGRFRLTSLKDLAALLRLADGRQQADLYVIRDGRIGRTRITLNPPAPGRL